MSHFEDGAQVWCAVPGHPFWPARITNASKVSQETRAGKTAQASTLVYFFGTHNYAWVAAEQCVEYKKHFTRHKRGSQAKEFRQAIQEAEEANQTSSSQASQKTGRKEQPIELPDDVENLSFHVRPKKQRKLDLSPYNSQTNSKPPVVVIDTPTRRKPLAVANTRRPTTSTPVVTHLATGRSLRSGPSRPPALTITRTSSFLEPNDQSTISSSSQQFGDDVLSPVIHSHPRGFAPLYLSQEAPPVPPPDQDRVFDSQDDTDSLVASDAESDADGEPTSDLQATPVLPPLALPQSTPHMDVDETLDPLASPSTPIDATKRGEMELDPDKTPVITLAGVRPPTVTSPTTVATSSNSLNKKRKRGSMEASSSCDTSLFSPSAAEPLPESPAKMVKTSETSRKGVGEHSKKLDLEEPKDTHPDASQNPAFSPMTQADGPMFSEEVQSHPLFREIAEKLTQHFNDKIDRFCKETLEKATNDKIEQVTKRQEARFDARLNRHMAKHRAALAQLENAFKQYRETLFSDDGMRE